MKESTLWKHLKDPMNRIGHFQKISDRFTPGVPDVIGSAYSIPIAIELKELSGVRIIKTKFRPRQLDWLRDWVEKGGGFSWILSTHGRLIYLHHYSHGEELEKGMTEARLIETCKLWTGSKSWTEVAETLVRKGMIT